mmetsp:Transcript_10762/g.35327  ORF Transcript_10762/g.35327 Transcript_10762/m.35327 type:complete len:220 (-) Transcript_10762:50-709(-)
MEMCVRRGRFIAAVTTSTTRKRLGHERRARCRLRHHQFEAHRVNPSFLRIALEPLRLARCVESSEAALEVWKVARHRQRVHAAHVLELALVELVEAPEIEVQEHDVVVAELCTFCRRQLPLEGAVGVQLVEPGDEAERIRRHLVRGFSRLEQGGIHGRFQVVGETPVLQTLRRFDALLAHHLVDDFHRLIARLLPRHVAHLGILVRVVTLTVLVSSTII